MVSDILMKNSYKKMFIKKRILVIMDSTFPYKNFREISFSDHFPVPNNFRESHCQEGFKNRRRKDRSKFRDFHSSFYLSSL